MHYLELGKVLCFKCPQQMKSWYAINVQKWYRSEKSIEPNRISVRKNRKFGVL